VRPKEGGVGVLILAHAFGRRYDLPVPLLLFVAGGGAVVFASFLLIAPTAVAAGSVATRPDRSGRRLGTSTVRWIVAGVLLLLIVVGFGGSQAVAENILPTVFWLLVWVAVPVSCGVFGDWTRYANPFVNVALLADRGELRRLLLGGPRLAWPKWLGWWPATILFFLLVCSELIYNSTMTLPRMVALGLVVYTLITFWGGLVFGAEAWLERGEAFSVLFATWGRLGWFRFGAPGSRGFLGGLRDTAFEATPSRVAFVLLTLVSVSFDGLVSTPTWRNLRLKLPAAYQLGTARYKIGETLALLALLGIVWLLLQAFAAAVSRVGRLGRSSFSTLALLLPSMLPISFGYLVCHNADYLAINGQLMLPLLGNPAGLARWPHFPYPFNDSYEPNINLVPTSVIWYCQVALIIAVHIAAIVIAHRDLAHAVSERRRARLAEWPWIVAMICYTMTSLWLLAQPVAKGG
jgi:hypothetical protein